MHFDELAISGIGFQALSTRWVKGTNVVIDTRTEEQKQADLKKNQEASEGLTGTIQAGGLGN